MPAKKHKPEEIIGKLREVEIVLGQGGTTAEACRRMGYRFELANVSHPGSAPRGSTFDLTVSLRSTGWSRLYNPRKLAILIRNPVSGEIIRLPSGGPDPRDWLPSAVDHEAQVAVSLPVQVPEGSYELLLALPDASARLREDPRYSIRFANADSGRQRWVSTAGAFATGTILEVR